MIHSMLFISCDRTEYQNDIYDFTQNLLEIRKNHKSLSEGKLTHFYPFDNVYVYFRETNDESTMIIVNGNDTEFEVDLNKYKETLAKTI